MTVLSEDYLTEQPTASILLNCLGYANGAAKTEQLARVTAEQWCKVVELAQQHGVAPLLYHHLKRLDIVLPDEMAVAPVVDAVSADLGAVEDAVAHLGVHSVRCRPNFPSVSL